MAVESQITNTLDAGTRGEGAFRLSSSASFVILGAVAVGGAVLMALEILAFRLIGKTFGSALRETSIVISIFLTAMSCGYAYGGRIADRWPRIESLTVPLAVAGGLGLMIPSLDRAVSPAVFSSGIPIYLHAATVTILLFAVPTVALATVSPVAIRLLLVDSRHGGRTAGAVSAVSTIGSITGSLSGAFILIDLFQSVDRSILFLSLLSIVVAVITEATFRGINDDSANRPRATRRTFALAAVLILALMSSWWISSDSAAVSAPADVSRIVFEGDSPFHHVVVVEDRGDRVMLFDNARQSRMPIGDPAGNGFHYTSAFHIPMLVRPNADTALFIGLGGGTGPKQFVADYPQMRVDAVDVDPLVTQVASEYFDVARSDRLTLHVEDGRSFIRRSSEEWDIIVVDAYTRNRYGSTIPSHLATVEFFLECKSRLTENGVLIFNVAESMRTPIARAVSVTLGAAFENQNVFTFEGSGNTVLAASDGELVDHAYRVSELVSALAEQQRFRPYRLEGRLKDVRNRPLESEGAPVLTDDYAPVDTLIRRGREAKE